LPKTVAEIESKLAKRIPKSGRLVGEVLDMSYHRNGVSGRGFWTILFVGHDDAEITTIAGFRFVATFFPREPDNPADDSDEFSTVEACVAVLRVQDLREGNADIAWRGDHFHDELQKLVDNYVPKHERTGGVQTDGTGREMTNRRGAIRAQKAKKASRS